MDTPHAVRTHPSSALLWREWREDRLFALAVVIALATSGRWCKTPTVVASIACGLVLGVRAYAPDSASGAGRFVAALPVPGSTVLQCRLGIRLAVVALGTLLGLSTGGGWELVVVGAATLYACLVGVLAGQVLDQSTTAFATGGVTLVVLGQLVVPALLAPGVESAWPHTGAALVLCLSAAAFVALSHWIAGQD